MKSFKILNDNPTSLLSARDECEEYCFNVSNCWGCNFDCENDCKWNSITECTKLKLNELEKGGITQKPGIFINNIMSSLTFLYERKIVLHINFLIFSMF